MKKCPLRKNSWIIRKNFYRKQFILKWRMIWGTGKLYSDFQGNVCWDLAETRYTNRRLYLFLPYKPNSYSFDSYTVCGITQEILNWIQNLVNCLYRCWEIILAQTSSQMTFHWLDSDSMTSNYYYHQCVTSMKCSVPCKKLAQESKICIQVQLVQDSCPLCRTH